MRYASRKFLIALGTIASASFLAYTHSIESSAYATVLVGVVGAYMAANVVQKRQPEVSEGSHA